MHPPSVGLPVLVDGAELLGVLDQGDQSRQGRALPLDVVRPPDGRPDIQPPNHLAWRPRRTAQPWHDADQRSRDSGLFETTRNQTHGLMADRSRWNQECRLDIVSLETGNHLRDRFPDERRHVRL